MELPPIEKPPPQPLIGTDDESRSINGLDDLSHVHAPESIIKPKKDKKEKKEKGEKKDKKEKKKKDKADKKLKVIDFNDEGQAEGDEDIDNIIQQQRSRLDDG